MNAAVIILRYSRPELKRPFKVPSIGRFPLTAGLGVAASLLLAAQYEWQVYLTFLIAILAGPSPTHSSAVARRLSVQAVLIEQPWLST